MFIHIVEMQPLKCARREFAYSIPIRRINSSRHFSQRLSTPYRSLNNLRDHATCYSHSKVPSRILPQIPARRCASTSTEDSRSSTSPTYEPTPNDPFQSFDPYANATSKTDEHIGYLYELGLDYGWGPTSFMQWALEHVYIWGELPWGATIVTTAVALRIFILPLAIQSADMGARLGAIQPEVAPITRRLQLAKENQDQPAMMEAASEYRKKLKSKGYSFSKMLMTPLVQLPLGFGTFRLLRGMANLPVPGFDEGGMLWFTDLSMPDPLCILPVASGLIFHLSFRLSKRSGETGSDQAGKATLVLFKYVFPAVTTFFGLWFPAGTQLALLTAAAFQALQSICFMTPMIRSILRMHPLPAKAPPVGQVINIKANSRPIVQDPEPSGIIAKPAWHIRKFGREVIKLGESATGKSTGKGGRKGLSYEDEQRAKAFEQKRRQLIKQRRSS